MLNRLVHRKSGDNSEAAFRMARILSHLDGKYTLAEHDYQFEAVTAFSCLVKPLPGDIVLYATTYEDLNVIVSIVSRIGEQKMAIEFPDTATIGSKAGSMNLISQDAISLSSKKINMFSESMVQNSDESFLNVRELHANGEKLNANFSHMMILSGFISTMAKQVVNKFVTYMRHSESFDQVKSANMTRSVQGLYAMDTEQTVMVSKKDTKIDAERIHLG